MYQQVTIHSHSSEIIEILIALLADKGYEGFQEEENILNAFIAKQDFNAEELQTILDTFQLTATINIIEKTNWNKEWEQNFSPVIVSDFCTVRADFHELEIQTPYEIIITPKMSFGTGHHATTQLMMQMMRRINFKGKTVLDFGTGTGILAMLQLCWAQVILPQWIMKTGLMKMLGRMHKKTALLILILKKVH